MARTFGFVVNPVALRTAPPAASPMNGTFAATFPDSIPTYEPLAFQGALQFPVQLIFP